MNKTKIEWTDYSWNPITGCDHGCWYCYAKRLFHRFGRSFKPAFHPNRLGQPAKVKKPSKVFVCSVSDLFAPWTKNGWREAVLASIVHCPIKHTFQLLTKNPERINKDYIFPRNVWVGTTVTQMSEAKNIDEIRKVRAGIRFVSFEPLLGSMKKADLGGIEWIIVGKLTGSRKVKLESEWVEEIIEKARHWSIPLFLKDNLNWPKKIQEFPKEKG